VQSRSRSLARTEEIIIKLLSLLISLYMKKDATANGFASMGKSSITHETDLLNCASHILTVARLNSTVSLQITSLKVESDFFSH
jgi:hypothetical protein